MLTLQNARSLHSQHQAHPCHSVRALGRKASKLFPGSQGPSLLVPFCFSSLMYQRFSTPPPWMFQNTQTSSHLHTFAQAAPTPTTSCTCATSCLDVTGSPLLYISYSLLYIPHSFLCSSTSTPCCLHLSLSFNYEALEGRNQSEFFSGSPLPSTGPGTQQHSMNAEYISR